MQSADTYILEALSIVEKAESGKDFRKVLEDVLAISEDDAKMICVGTMLVVTVMAGDPKPYSDANVLTLMSGAFLAGAMFARDRAVEA